MTPFKNFTGLVAPLLHDNIDTDAIIPSREIRSPEKTGFGEKLFSAWRYLDHQQTENPAFILNQDGYRHSSILLAGQNFGCGSSREMAV
jgi:3-isopropylmalate/(R)-2-methylmalate dehydratase small subunit